MNRDDPTIAPLPTVGHQAEPGMRDAVARDAAIRFAGTMAAAAFMALTGVVAARALGPDGKGTVSTLSYLAALVASVITLGLGDAAVVLHGQRRVELPRLARLTVAGTFAAGLVGAAVVTAVGTLLVGSLALSALAALTVPFTGLTLNLMRLDEARHRMAFATSAHVVFAATSAVASVALVWVLDLGREGAVLALLVGPMVSSALLAWDLRRAGLLPTGRRPGRHLPTVLRLGLPMMGANALRILFRRIDMVMVFALATADQAGYYSVALTMGEVALYAPAAVAAAMFPRVATLSDGDDPAGFIAELSRGAIVVAVALVVPLVALTPIVIPAAFGSPFTESVGPAVLLLLGSVPMSAHWVVARAAAARGHPEILVRTFALAVGSMLVLDLLLVPRFAAAGAAVAAGLAGAAGFALSVHDLRVRVAPVAWVRFLPTHRDIARVGRFVAASARRS